MEDPGNFIDVDNQSALDVNPLDAHVAHVDRLIQEQVP